MSEIERGRAPIAALYELCKAAGTDFRRGNFNFHATASGAAATVKIIGGWYRVTVVPADPPIQRCPCCGRELTEDER